MASKVRKGPQAARAVREGFAAGVQVGPSAYYLYSPERMQRILQATRHTKQLPRDCQPGGARPLQLRRSLGIATVELADLEVPRTLQQLDRLKKVQRTALALHNHLMAVDDGRNVWSEVQYSMSREKRETGVDTLWHQSPIDPGHFPWMVGTIATLADETHRQIARRAPKSTADLDRYIDALSHAYEAFFEERPGYSTDKEDQSSRIGAFIRFARAVAHEANIELSPEQVTKRVKKQRKMLRDRPNKP